LRAEVEIDFRAGRRDRDLDPAVRQLLGERIDLAEDVVPDGAYASNSIAIERR
jgi:hypothetical protein